MYAAHTRAHTAINRKLINNIDKNRQVIDNILDKIDSRAIYEKATLVFTYATTSITFVKQQ